MATGLHAHRDGVDRLVSPLRECFTNCPATTRGLASPVNSRTMFVALREKKAKSTQQSGERHAVVLGSDKSIQKKRHNPVLNSHPARKTSRGNLQAEVIETLKKKKGRKNKNTKRKE